jgi:hypothetical protein
MQPQLLLLLMLLRECDTGGDDGEDNTITRARKRKVWTTVSAGPNIIAASFAALVDGYEYHLAEHVDHKYL